MKIWIAITLLIMPCGVFANSPEAIKEFANKVQKNNSYNKDCEIGNYQLLAADNFLKAKVTKALNDFGGMGIADFDMGECVSNDNFEKSVFVTHFWQKNKEKLNHRLDFFVAYDFADSRVLSVIVDNDLKAYFMGDVTQDLKNILKTMPNSINNFSQINMNTNFKFIDFKEYKEEELENTNGSAENSKITEDLKPEVTIGSQWTSTCKKDRFDGSKMCFMSSRDLMVGILNGAYTVYVGGDHYPNTSSAIKIDNNETIYGYEGHSRTPAKVIEQMKKGKVAYTRYKKWPYEYNRDSEVDLAGFTIKFNELSKRYRNL
jgi:hypothetical protein